MVKVVVKGPRSEVRVELRVIICVDVEGAGPDIVNVSYTVAGPESDFEAEAVVVCDALDGADIFSLSLPW